MISDDQIKRYIEELNKEGFEVFTHTDIYNFPSLVYVTVRKNDVKCKTTMMAVDYYSNPTILDYVLRNAVRVVENKLKEENK